MWGFQSLLTHSNQPSKLQKEHHKYHKSTQKAVFQCNVVAEGSKVVEPLENNITTACLDPHPAFDTLIRSRQWRSIKVGGMSNTG